MAWPDISSSSYVLSVSDVSYHQSYSNFIDSFKQLSSGNALPFADEVFPDFFYLALDDVLQETSLLPFLVTYS